MFSILSLSREHDSHSFHQTNYRVIWCTHRIPQCYYVTAVYNIVFDMIYIAFKCFFFFFWLIDWIQLFEVTFPLDCCGYIIFFFFWSISILTDDEKFWFVELVICTRRRYPPVGETNNTSSRFSVKNIYIKKKMFTVHAYIYIYI